MNSSIINNNLTRSTDDSVVAGVCGGLAQRFNIDSWIVRVALTLSVVMLGFGAFLYIILAFSLPKDTDIQSSYESKILGVCSRLAQKNNWDVGIVRFVFASCLLLSVIPSFGTTLLIYFVLHFFLPARANSNVVDVKAKDLN